MILICYDGSPDARAAIEHAGGLFGGQPAIVLTVWETFVDSMARSGAGMALGAGLELDTQRIDAESEGAARERAEQGAQLARRAGLDPQPRTASRSGTIARTILDEAAHANAGAIVIGSRGLTGVKSLLLGSVSHAVLQSADRPVLVVPSPEAASDRAAHRR